MPLGVHTAKLRPMCVYVQYVYIWCVVGYKRYLYLIFTGTQSIESTNTTTSWCIHIIPAKTVCPDIV